MIIYGALAVLLGLAIVDIKKKEVPVWLLILFTLPAIMGFLQKDVPEKIYVSLILGIFSLLFLLVKKRKSMGGADLWAIGGCLGSFSAAVFHRGIVLAAGLSAILALIFYLKRRDKKETLPFLPFLWIGMMISQILSLWMKSG